MKTECFSPPTFETDFMGIKWFIPTIFDVETGMIPAIFGRFIIDFPCSVGIFGRTFVSTVFPCPVKCDETRNWQKQRNDYFTIVKNSIEHFRPYFDFVEFKSCVNRSIFTPLLQDGLLSGGGQ